MFPRWGTQWKFGYDRARTADFHGEILVAGRVDTINSATKHRYRNARFQCAPVCASVDTKRQAAGDNQAERGKLTSDIRREFAARFRRVATPDDCNLGMGEKFCRSCDE